MTPHRFVGRRRRGGGGLEEIALRKKGTQRRGQSREDPRARIRAEGVYVETLNKVEEIR